MTLATTILALTLIGPTAPTSINHTAARAPAPPCIAPAHTGAFRVTTSRTDGTDPRPAMLVLENINGCLEVNFVTDETSPAIMDQLALDGDMLKGAINLQQGVATVSLQFNGNNVAGSIVTGHQTWRLDGRRTT